MANSIDLQTLFNAVSQQLSEKKDKLNDADAYNHNHGDHMVKIFNLVQSAVSEKSDKPIEDQLSYASKIVKQKGDSGSAALYAEGLSKAAEKFSGRELNENNISVLLQSLFGAEKPSQKPDQRSGNISAADEADQSFGIDDILNAGMSFYQSKQDGDTNLEAIMDAIMGGSPMRKTPHREQSATIVTSTIMKFFGNLDK